MESMPSLGLGIHIIVAIFFAIHAVRSGQPLYWLLILFSFPLLGSIVYGLVVFLPNSGWERQTRRAVSSAMQSLDFGRELREARSAFEYTPTANNHLRLATALLNAGEAEQAALHYEACLTGPFASDLDIRLSAARAFAECRRPADAIAHLEAIRHHDANFRAESVALALAQAYVAAGRSSDAQVEFEEALRRFGSFDAQAEYAIWAYSIDDLLTAEPINTAMDQSVSRWTRATRQHHKATLGRVRSAREAARQRAAGSSRTNS